MRPHCLCFANALRRQRENHLHRSDQAAVGKRRQDQPSSLLGLGREALECGPRVLRGERLHVADRGAAHDAVVEDGRERVEVIEQLGRLQAEGRL